jgi:hypothetical protein
MSIERVAIGRLARSLPPSERGAFVLFVVMLVRAGCAYAEESGTAAHGSGREPQDRDLTPAAARRERGTMPWSAPTGGFSPGLSLTDVAPTFQLPSDYSPREYRALGPDLARRESRSEQPATNPPLHASSAWERLADFKTRGGIRLLTLWDSKFASLSLQTGHGGIPSLQWTSRGFGGSAGSAATRGVLDRLLATGIDRLDVLKHALHPVPAGAADHPVDRRDN